MKGVFIRGVYHLRQKYRKDLYQNRLQENSFPKKQTNKKSRFTIEFF